MNASNFKSHKTRIGMKVKTDKLIYNIQNNKETINPSNITISIKPPNIVSTNPSNIIISDNLSNSQLNKPSEILSNSQLNKPLEILSNKPSDILSNKPLNNPSNKPSDILSNSQLNKSSDILSNKPLNNPLNKPSNIMKSMYQPNNTNKQTIQKNDIDKNNIDKNNIDIEKKKIEKTDILKRDIFKGTIEKIQQSMIKCDNPIDQYINIILSKYPNNKIYTEIKNILLKKYTDICIDYDVLYNYDKCISHYSDPDKTKIIIGKIPNGSLNIKTMLDDFKIIKSKDIPATFILMITLYDEKNNIRFNELHYCLTINLANPFISKIIVFYEKQSGKFEKYLINKKITVIPIITRPSYNQFIEYANTSLNGENIIISNSDIFFNNTLALLTNDKMTNNMFALTRLNITKHINNIMMYSGQDTYASQDVWIYKSPIKPLETNLMIGTMTCDSFLNAHIVCNKDINIFNVSSDVLAFHYHIDPNSWTSCKNISEYDLYIEAHKNEIINSTRRLLLCGIPLVKIDNLPEKTLFYYPNGNTIHNKCLGCDECMWTQFFNKHMNIYDHIISCCVPMIITFDKCNVFTAIKNSRNPQFILKILSSYDGISYFNVDYTILNDTVYFKYYTEAKYFKIYYKVYVEIDKINFEIYDVLSDKNILIVGICKNIESSVDRTIKNITRIKTYFNKCKVFIYENNSTDKTSSMLVSQINNINDFIVGTENIKEYNDLYKRMARARNKCIEFIKSNNKDYQYVLILDLDLVIDIPIMSIMNCFNHNESWDVQTANSIYDKDYHYWDTFALRLNESDPPFFYERDNITGGNLYWKKHCNIPSKQKQYTKFTNVISAFGGLGIYKIDCFDNAMYDENINDCEHVPFHKQLIKNNKKIIINPKMIKFYSSQETNGSYYNNKKFIDDGFDKNKYFDIYSPHNKIKEYNQ
jgi:hypothetical protein